MDPASAVGIASGLREAWRFHWWLALLMAALMVVIAAFLIMTVRRIRSESAGASTSLAPAGGQMRAPQRGS